MHRNVWVIKLDNEGLTGANRSVWSRCL